MIHSQPSRNTESAALFLMDTKSNKCCYLTSSEIDNMILGATPISAANKPQIEIFDRNMLVQISDALKSKSSEKVIECKTPLPEHIICSFVN